MAAIAMTVNAYKTRALFDGKLGVETAATSAEKEAPEPDPGKT